MASERPTQIDTADHATTNPNGAAPWVDLQVTIPNGRDHASLVECALVELTHEQVEAVVARDDVDATSRLPPGLDSAPRRRHGGRVMQQTLTGCAFCAAPPGTEAGKAHTWGEDERITQARSRHTGHATLRSASSERQRSDSIPHLSSR